MRYTIYGWTHDNSWSADGPEFTADELQQLRPGEVLYWDGAWEADGETPRSTVAGRAAFFDTACP